MVKPEDANVVQKCMVHLVSFPAIARALWAGETKQVLTEAFEEHVGAEASARICRFVDAGLVSCAFKRMGYELAKNSSGAPLDMAAVRTVVEELDGVNMEDSAELLLLRVMLHCSLHVLLSAKDMREAYPVARNLILLGERIDESNKVTELRSTLDLEVKKCAQTGLSQGKEVMVAKMTEIRNEWPVRKLVDDLRTFARTLEDAHGLTQPAINNVGCAIGDTDVRSSKRARIAGVSDTRLSSPYVISDSPLLAPAAADDDTTDSESEIPHTKVTSAYSRPAITCDSRGLYDRSPSGRRTNRGHSATVEEISGALGISLTGTTQSYQSEYSDADADVDVGADPDIDGDVEYEGEELEDDEVLEEGGVESEGKEEDDEYICKYCFEGFASERAMEMHIRSVHQERKFKCPQCKSRFKQKNSLETHIRTVHNDERPFHCDQCDSKFGQKQTLKRHINTVHRKSGS